MKGEHLPPAAHGTASRPAAFPSGPRISTIALSLSLALAAIAGTAAPATALAQTPAASPAQQDFSIPAGSLKDALDALGAQSGITVMYSPELIQGRKTRGLSGRHAPGEALRQLLLGTGVVAEGAGEGTYVLKAQAAAPATKPAKPQSRPEPSAMEEAVKNMPAIMVTGARTLNMDIMRTEDDIQPYVVFDRREIESSVSTNIEDFLRRNLSSATTFEAPNQSETAGGFPAGNTSSINLRGLGSDETLILVDGRRVPGFSFLGNPQQADINAIPLSAVERIEVLPSTASGIYGGGATGGVINIVLRRDYSGMEGRISYDNTFSGGGAARKFSLSGGVSSKNKRTNFIYAATYSDAEDLLLGQRDFAELRLEKIIANSPELIFDVATPILGATTNIRSTNGSDLTLRSNGQSIGSPITYVPYGYKGVGIDGGAAFTQNASGYNLDLANTAQAGGARRALLNSPKVKSIILSARHEFTPRVDGFVDIGLSENIGRFLSNPSSGRTTFSLAATDSMNPFNEAVRVTAPGLGADQMVSSRIDTRRLSAGLIFQLSNSWRGEADWVWSQTKMQGQSPSFDANAARADILSGALDIFSDMNLGGNNFSTYLQNPQTFGPAKSMLKSMAVVFSGPLPWISTSEAPSLTIKAEHREEKFGDFRYVASNTAVTQFEIISPERSQTVDSLYSELLIPFMYREDQDFGSNLLELQLAVRYDSYRTAGASQVTIFNGVQNAPSIQAKNEFSSIDPTIGLRLKPTSSLTLRASYGTGFLPPNVNQLVTNPPSPTDYSFFNLADPLRGDEPLGLVTVLNGGNPNLLPEEAESWSAGFVYKPSSIPELRLSMDWTKIYKSDAITTIAVVSDLGTYIEFLPERITRDQNPETWGSFGVGPIVGIDQTLVNISTSKIEAIDFSASYRLETTNAGAFLFDSKATRMIHNITRATPVAPVLEGSGLRANLEWRANMSVAWEYGPWNAAWSTYYYGPYCLLQGCEQATGLGKSTVPSQTYHDLYISYRPNRHRFPLLADTTLELGIRNVLNKTPPVDVSASAFAYSPLGDPRLRSYQVAIRKSF